MENELRLFRFKFQFRFAAKKHCEIVTNTLSSKGLKHLMDMFQLSLCSHLLHFELLQLGLEEAGLELVVGEHVRLQLAVLGGEGRRRRRTHRHQRTKSDGNTNTDTILTN